MKKILLTLLTLISLCIQAEERQSIKNLQPSDVVSMRITIPAENAVSNSVWDFEHGHKIDIDLHVLSVDEDSIKMGVKPTRLLTLFDSPTVDGSFAYFDTNYYTYYDNKPWFYLFEDNSVVASISINNSGVRVSYKDKTSDINLIEEESSTGRSRKEWYIQSLNIPKGLKVMNYGGAPTADVFLDFDKIIKISLNAFAKEWHTKSDNTTSIPWMIDLRATSKNDPDSPIFIQITSASFDLAPNTTISFIPSKEIPEDNIFMLVGNEKIYPTKIEDDTYQFTLFLSSPKRTHISELALDLTPEDSLMVHYNAATKDYTFSGKGAANNSFSQKISPLYDGRLPNIESHAKDEMFLENTKRNFSKNEEFFRSTLNQYMDEMNDYWIRSAKLSFNYWYINERLNLYNKTSERFDFDKLPILKQFLRDNPDELNEFNKYYNLSDLDKLRDEASIPWYKEFFTDVFPFVDYLYQPYTYHSFVTNFFTLKAKETGNTTMTGMNYLQDYIPSYYFAKSVFFGYPRSYLNSETLKNLMINFQLERSNREYEDFLKNMHDPEIRQSVVSLHQQMEKIEPGASIKKLDLDIEKYIPLTNRSDEYIILLVGDSLGYNYITNRFFKDIKTIYNDMDSKINEENLNTKVKLCFITNEHNKSALDDTPDLQ